MARVRQVRRHLRVISLDDGVSVMGQIVDVEPLSIQQGTRVRATVRALGRESNGNPLYGYKFVRMPEAESADAR